MQNTKQTNANRADANFLDMVENANSSPALRKSRPACGVIDIQSKLLPILIQPSQRKAKTEDVSGHLALASYSMQE
jgi:hypothetical protein